MALLEISLSLWVVHANFIFFYGLECIHSPAYTIVRYTSDELLAQRMGIPVEGPQSSLYLVSTLVKRW